MQDRNSGTVVKRLLTSALCFGLSLIAVAVGASSCGGNSTGGNYDTGDTDGKPTMTLPTPGPSQNLEPNGTARVTTDYLNLRDLAGIAGTVITSMPCGSTLSVIAGPSTTPVSGWWRVLYTDANNAPYTGWASGQYLVGAAQFDPSTCAGFTAPDGGIVTPDGGTTTPDGGMPPDGGIVTPPSTPITAIFDRAKLGVGYSYWWGHGAWAGNGGDIGSCSGNCPSCTHSGSYGADCSGFVSKVWQVPSATPMPTDQHPYSTVEFYNDQVLWTQLSRSGIMPADAMVYRSGNEGHIVLFESGSDPFGDVWIYEARGCATGIQHNLRAIGSAYRTIRLNNP